MNLIDKIIAESQNPLDAAELDATHLTMRLPKPTLKWVRVMSELTGLSKSELIQCCILTVLGHNLHVTLGMQVAAYHQNKKMARRTRKSRPQWAAKSDLSMRCLSVLNNQALGITKEQITEMWDKDDGKM